MSTLLDIGVSDRSIQDVAKRIERVRQEGLAAILRIHPLILLPDPVRHRRPSRCDFARAWRVLVSANRSSKLEGLFSQGAQTPKRSDAVV